MIVGPDETRNQDLLCWRGLAAIYPTDSPVSLELHRHSRYLATTSEKNRRLSVCCSCSDL
jgi:hypothetical protein